jgi:hypothetical protein
MLVRSGSRRAMAAASLAAAGCLLMGGCGGPPPAAPAPPPVTTTTTPAPAPKGPRPANGQVIVSTGGSGTGTLVVDDGGTQDAYATLALGRQVIRGFYIQAGQKGTVTDVPNGTYQLYFATGTGWNEDLRAFTSNRSATKYDDPFPFDGDQNTGWTASIKPTVGGNAQTQAVSEADFPR